MATMKMSLLLRVLSRALLAQQTFAIAQFEESEAG
jgi:hypothetical protein